MATDNAVSISMNGGYVIVDPTVSAGTVRVTGTGLVLDLSTGTAVIDTAGLMNTAAIADTVLDEMVSQHQIPGSVGEAISSGGSGGGMDAEDKLRLLEIFRILGLDPTKPLISSPTSMQAGDIVQDITDVNCVVTVRRRE